MKKPELLAPAGNFEKLRYALHYGADAVYCAGKKFGLRAKADNFDLAALAEAVAYVHERNKKIYVTLNMIPHNADLEGLPEYVSELENLGRSGALQGGQTLLEQLDRELVTLVGHLTAEGLVVAA